MGVRLGLLRNDGGVGGPLHKTYTSPRRGLKESFAGGFGMIVFPFVASELCSMEPYHTPSDARSDNPPLTFIASLELSRSVQASGPQLFLSSPLFNQQPHDHLHPSHLEIFLTRVSRDLVLGASLQRVLAVIRQNEVCVSRLGSIDCDNFPKLSKDVIERHSACPRVSF
ncbi:hypothetical protein FA13DRAFT_1454072 [Coprinellus micaceus]|uniref:Uncharacterized protein n=1 Tax=Coprinellus micaceus TaxID=71717 RepID=A0A4Y7SNK1_COPMI|nr:hypothetical protein FA13DRAFT_1454072 [Coprinellus micaceus]